MNDSESIEIKILRKGARKVKPSYVSRDQAEKSLSDHHYDHFDEGNTALPNLGYSQGANGYDKNETSLEDAIDLKLELFAFFKKHGAKTIKDAIGAANSGLVNEELYEKVFSLPDSALDALIPYSLLEAMVNSSCNNEKNYVASNGNGHIKLSLSEIVDFKINSYGYSAEKMLKPERLKK